VKWPVTSSKSDVHVVFSHAGRLIMDINSWMSQCIYVYTYTYTKSTLTSCML
jgi:hypothetical protein